MDECVGRQEAAAEASLSQALAAESTYWGTGAVQSVQATWSAFVQSECSAQSAVNKGGSIYPEVFGQCVLQLVSERLNDVNSTLATLRKTEVPQYPAGSFPIAISPSS